MPARALKFYCVLCNRRVGQVRTGSVLWRQAGHKKRNQSGLVTFGQEHPWIALTLFLVVPFALADAVQGAQVDEHVDERVPIGDGLTVA